MYSSAYFQHLQAFGVHRYEMAGTIKGIMQEDFIHNNQRNPPIFDIFLDAFHNDTGSEERPQARVCDFR